MPRNSPSPSFSPLGASPTNASFAMVDAVFPIEICERIIAAFVDNPMIKYYWKVHYASLKACTLVCKDWLPSALYCLHREICLAKTTNCFQLLDVLAEHPTASPGLDGISH
ncbi:hypothetical protein ACG7TL_008110 [Trametes sanguinea]